MQSRTFLAWTVLGMLVSIDAAPGAPQAEPQVVGPVGQDVKYVVSPRGAHLASVSRKGSRLVVTVDGAAGPKLDEVLAVTPYVDPRALRGQMVAQQPVVFSADGNRHAYVARLGQELVVMVDGKEVLRLPTEGSTGSDMRLAFTGEDGKHLLFSRASFAGFELWADGKKLPGTYLSGGGGTEGTMDPLITADGAHFAYIANLDPQDFKKRSVVVDGQDAGYFGDNLQFTADGQHLFSFSRDGAVVGLVVDGKLKIKTDGIHQLALAPTGNAFAAVLMRSSPAGQFLIVNAKKVEGSDCADIPKVVFSPDGKRFAAHCSAAANVHFVLVDGKKGQQYDAIQPGTIAFSPDSSKLGYVAMSAGKYFVVIDEEESDAFDSIAEFQFSRDGKRLVYGGIQQGIPPGGFALYVDGKPERLDRQVSLFTFTFSPDGSRYAYTGGNSGVYADGKATELAGEFTFSPDGKHLAVWGYRAADNRRALFVDGVPVYANEQNFGVRNRAFTPDGQHLHWLAFEPAKDPSAGPGAYDFVSYIDGKPVARCSRVPAFDQLYPTQQPFQMGPAGTMQRVDALPAAWQIGPDGTLTMLGPVGEAVQRFTVTPSSETSVATLVAAAAK